jgi:hypothetical protein
MTSRQVVVCVLSLAAFGGTVTYTEELKGTIKEQAQKQLESLFLNKQLVAKVTFPAHANGINLGIDGSWDMKMVTRLIKDKGVGIEVDEKASVTNVKLKGDMIEIHLNGGGVGTLGDSLFMGSAKKEARNLGTGKAPGGSRINLRFGRDITEEDLRQLDKLIEYLEPVVDSSSLRQAASRNAIPDEFKEAAARGEVVAGMDKPTVFAIMGDPKSKAVDMNVDPPVEKWQFEMKDLKTRVVTFRQGKVAKVDEF